MSILEGEKILVTGATGQVAYPIVRELAKGNQVYAMARFSRSGSRELIEAAGAQCIGKDIGRDGFDDLPDDFSYVLNVATTDDTNWNSSLELHAIGMGRLMYHCRKVKAFFHCSTTAVYKNKDGKDVKEDDPLADRAAFIVPTYSISKIAGEAMVKFVSVQFGIPTLIARLNVPYGPNGGVPAKDLESILQGREIPVHPDGPSYYNPLHEDDYIRHIPLFLAHAQVPPIVVNWGGSERVSQQSWCDYLGQLVGMEPRLVPTEPAFGTISLDLTLMHQLVGRTKVHWRDGMLRMVRAWHPDLALKTPD